jgi:DNA-binding MarR family transcriptional regulator
MSIAWQAVDDEIQLLARIFLAIFVLIGLIPFFQKSFSRWHDYIISLRRPRAPGLVASIYEPEAAASEPSRMNDIEYIVFRRLSQAGGRGVSLSYLAKSLHMESLLIRRALQSLHERGLVRITPGLVIGRRFSLSREGYALALAEGLTPKLVRQKQI